MAFSHAPGSGEDVSHPGEDVSSDPAVFPRSVTQERIASWLATRGFHFFTDSDNDLGGLWHSRLFYFFLLGEDQEILQVRSQWNREVVIERIDEILPFCNEWNAERVWPKTYIRVRDNGMIQVCAEVSIDLEKGINDDQLDQQLVCSLGSQNNFFDALDALYPDPARTAR